MTWCPAHNDGAKSRKRSLGLSSTGVLKCFAGCTESPQGFGEVIEMLRERSGFYRNQPSTPPATTPPPASRADGNLVDVYDYRNADGKLVAQKGRFEVPGGGKSFKWRHSINSNVWDGADMADMPLWGSELIAKAPPEDWVVFCEGEKATKACREAGLMAVCHGGGSSTRKFGDSLLVLQNRKVALWPDNDEPGRKYMMAIQRELLKAQIPMAIHVINAPVPPKGDAYEFFQAGGKAEDLFQSSFTEPVVSVVTRDYITVTLPTDLGPVIFHFDGLVYESRTLACEFTVEVTMPATTQEQYTIRSENILSSSWREGTVRALGKMYGDNNWTLAVNAAISRARAALIECQQSVQLSEGSADVDDMPPEMEFRVEAILAEGQPTCLFADGESGKTWLSYAIGLSVATGNEFLGLKVKQGSVLIIDWETDEQQAKRRLKRLLKGQSIQTMPDSIFYHAGGGIPLSEHVESIRRLVREKSIDLIIIDSGAPAAGAPPEDSRGTIAFFNAIARLGATCLIICHVNKADAVKGGAEKPFGSAFWHNLSRRTFFLGYDKPTSDQINMAAICRKSNDGRRPQPIAFTLTFTGAEGIGPVLISPVNFRSVSAFEVFLPATERIWLMLNSQGEMMFVEILKAMGWQGDDYAERLTRILRWGKENGWFKPTSEPGKQIHWVAIGEGPAQKS